MKIGFMGALQLFFIGLKHGGAIDWGWGAVLIPAWIWLGVIALCFLVALRLAAIEQAQRQKWRQN